MSTLKNHVQLIGRLGADVEIKSSVKGVPYAQLRLATNEYVKTSSGEWKENTQWHTLMVWGEQTKILEQNGRKGTQILVQGSLQYREYSDANQVSRIVAEIRVNTLMPFHHVPKYAPQESIDSTRSKTDNVPF